MSINFPDAVSSTKNFWLAPSEKKKLGEMNDTCSKISEKMRNIGQNLKQLASKDKTKLDERSRMEKRLKIADHLSQSIKELRDAVDLMVIQSQRLNSAKPIDQMIKFEQKLEKTSAKLSEAITGLRGQVDKGTNKKLKEIAANLKEIAEKCKASEQELAIAKVSFETRPDIYKKVSHLAKYIPNTDPGHKLKQRVTNFFVSQFSGLATEKIKKTVTKEIAIVQRQNAVIKDQLDSINTMTEVSVLLPQIETTKNHLRQMIDLSKRMEGNAKEPELGEIIQMHDKLFEELDKCELFSKELTERKRIFEVRDRAEDLSLEIKKLDDYDLTSQLDLKNKLNSELDNLNKYKDISVVNYKLQNKVKIEIHDRIIRLDNVLLDANEITQDMLTNYINRFENELKGVREREELDKRSGNWNSNRMPQSLDLAKKEIHLLSQARQRLPVDEGIEQKLRSLNSLLMEMGEVHQQSLQIRADATQDIKDLNKAGLRDIKTTLADKRLTPEQKIIQVQKLEGELRLNLHALREFEVSAEVPLYVGWKTASEEANSAIAYSQRQIASLEAKIQFPEFHRELKSIQADYKKCLKSSELTVTQKLTQLNELVKRVSEVSAECKKIPITEKMSEHKEFQQILQEAAKIERSLQNDLRGVEVDVSGLNFVTRFLIKASRSINVMQHIGGALNSVTILRGASKRWDPERLKRGKHEALHQLGAEHVQLHSKTGCVVDAHYLSASALIDRLEKLGGERKIFTFEADGASIFTGREVQCEIEGDFPVTMQELELKGDQLKRTKFGTLEIELELDKFTVQKNYIVEDGSGGFFKVDRIGRARLIKAGLLKKEIFTKDARLADSAGSADFSINAEFPGIKFNKNDSDWEKAVKLLDAMDVSESQWSLVKTSDAIYLVPVEHQAKVTLGINGNQFGGGEVHFTESSAKELVDSDKRGTVLLTTNQSDIYEQHASEMLNFALLGVNVLTYNNPGKGLSTGAADRQNIDASIEAAYQFLKKDKNTPDERILAKGQCFGGAPTAWLGKEHPEINLMLDQNPANFNDIAVEFVKSLPERLPVNQENSKIQWLKKMLDGNFVVIGIAKIIFGEYNVPADLAHNKGHKLIHVDVPNYYNLGGDQLVPPHHPELMIDGLSDSEGKEATLSMNPGARHVTNWWRGESQETVIRFLERTRISQPVF